jgi:hypothetical protein
MPPDPLTFARVFVVGVAATLGGCGGGPDSSAVPATQILAGSTSGRGEDALNAAVSTARADLARRLGVAESALAVLEARRVTWRSGDLGCPEPGMSYPQVLTPGVLVVLAADGTRYRYHGTPGAAPAYCPADRAQPPAAGAESDR